MAGLRRPGFRHPDGFAVDRAHDAVPAGEGLLEVEIDGGDEVVPAAFEVGVLFLRMVSISRSGS